MGIQMEMSALSAWGVYPFCMMQMSIISCVLVNCHLQENSEM